MHRNLLSAYLLILHLTVPPQSPKYNKNIWMMVTKEEGQECTFKDEFRGPVFVTESHPTT